MAILYIGLGIAMVSGISAMMQIGNNVNNLMLLSTFKQNEYYKSDLPSYDRKIMDILENYSDPFLSGKIYGIADFYFYMFMQWDENKMVELAKRPNLEKMYNQINQIPSIQKIIKNQPS